MRTKRYHYYYLGSDYDYVVTWLSSLGLTLRGKDTTTTTIYYVCTNLVITIVTSQKKYSFEAAVSCECPE